MKYETERMNPGFPLNQIHCFGICLSTEKKKKKHEKTQKMTKTFRRWQTNSLHTWQNMIHVVRHSSHMELTSWKMMPGFFQETLFPTKLPNPMYTVTGSTSLNAPFVSFSIKQPLWNKGSDASLLSFPYWTNYTRKPTQLCPHIQVVTHVF